MFATILALFFTVVLLVTTAYFLMGGLPLLVLQHDTPVDSKFIRRFFDVYYKTALTAACGACISYALWGKLPFSLGTGAVALVVFAIRRRVLPAMERLGARLHDSDAAALSGFRRVHLAALAANLAQLVFLVWGLTQLSF